LASVEEQAIRRATDALWRPLEQERAGRPHLRTWDGDAYRDRSWDDWRAAAEASARGLLRAGVRRGSSVGAVLTNGFAACAAVIGTWLDGATLVSLPTKPRGMGYEEYLGLLARACRAADAEVLLLEQEYAALVDPGLVGVRIASFESLLDPGPFEPDLPDDDDVAFVQFSSGSTREPRGCMLTPRAIAAQLELLSERLGVGPHSQAVSWLPLSHDMGLFGALLLSWSTGMPLVLGTPQRFLRSPRTWFQDCADFQATGTAGPNFALALAARAAAASPPSRRFPLKDLVLGGERIDWATVTEADRVLGPYGVTLSSITPAYGLAEATLAVTAKPADASAHAIAVDADALVAGRVERCGEDHPRASWIVSCGAPLPGVDVTAGAGGEPGRVRIGTPSLASGYLEDPAATEEAFRDGAFVTGDLGVLHGGELYVLGRTDDVVSAGGRKVHARDVEATLGEIPGLRAGSCVLVDVPNRGRPSLVALAEAGREQVPLARIAPELRRRVYETAGVRLAECVLLERGALPKTPSGKVQRFRCREIVMNDAASIVERFRC
jgi:fatty-acyl-CoA synthase